MANEMSSRDRMIAALNRQKPDRIPMAFMIFRALHERLARRGRGSDLPAVVMAQIELGLDTVVDLCSFAPPGCEAPIPMLRGCPCD